MNESETPYGSETVWGFFSKKERPGQNMGNEENKVFLKLKGIKKSFGGVHALRGVDL